MSNDVPLNRDRRRQLQNRQLHNSRLQDLELTEYDGGNWRLADQHGRPVLLLLHRHLM